MFARIEVIRDEYAQILHKVNKLTWEAAMAHALNDTVEEMVTFISKHYQYKCDGCGGYKTSTERSCDCFDNGCE